MINFILQVLCILGALTTLWLIGDKKKVGFIIGMVQQIFWCAFFTYNKSYWLNITSVIYFVMYLRGYLKWKKT